MDYLVLNGIRYRLVQDDGEHCEFGEKPVRNEVGDIGVGEVCKIGKWEFIVCEHTGEGTVLLMKDCLYDNEEFGSRNDYNGSNVDMLCEKFAEELATVVGAENIILHTVDLTADDGLKDYGSIERRVSLFTADQYRKYVYILDKYKLDAWWWLATPWSTPTHEESVWVKCVSPLGGIGGDDCGGNVGVRPFCILNSNIFVSK